MDERDLSLDVDIGFINPEDDEPPARPMFHAPAAQDFQNEATSVSLAPEDRPFELAEVRANYPNASLLQQEMDSGRWWMYQFGGRGLPDTVGKSDAMVLQLDENLQPYWGWVRAI